MKKKVYRERRIETNLVPNTLELPTDSGKVKIKAVKKVKNLKKKSEK